MIGGVFRHEAISIGGRCVGPKLLQEELEEKKLTTENKIQFDEKIHNFSNYDLLIIIKLQLFIYLLLWVLNC